MRDEHEAALILCKKVLEFEPNNETAKEFLPVLQERLKLGKLVHVVSLCMPLVLLANSLIVQTLPLQECLV